MPSPWTFPRDTTKAQLSEFSHKECSCKLRTSEFQCAAHTQNGESVKKDLSHCGTAVPALPQQLNPEVAQAVIAGSICIRSQIHRHQIHHQMLKSTVVKCYFLLLVERNQLCLQLMALTEVLIF